MNNANSNAAADKFLARERAIEAALVARKCRRPCGALESSAAQVLEVEFEGTTYKVLVISEVERPRDQFTMCW